MTNTENARTSDSTDIKRTKNKYDEQLYANEFDNSHEVAKFAEKQNSQNSLKKK